jgi:segregation and condensation protein A
MLQLKLENFDGPLDLLLHLIKIHEIDIFNIPIVLITHQYLNYLSQVDMLDFHLAGDYLVMASQLIEIKTKMLIPILQQGQGEEEALEEALEEDPRQKLVEQLLEYQSIKQLAQMFEKRGEAYQNLFFSGEAARREDEFESFEKSIVIKGNPFELIIAFERILLRYQKKKREPQVKVFRQKITIQQQMIKIFKLITKNETLSFFELSQGCVSRYEIIVLFMAILELAKERLLHLKQGALFEDIILWASERIKEPHFQLNDIFKGLSEEDAY